MNPCNQQLICPHISKAVSGGVLCPRGRAAHLWAQHRDSPYLPLILGSAVTCWAVMLTEQLPSSSPPMSQTLPVSTGIYFQPSRFLSICSRNPLAILRPDGRLQLKGTGSWRVFSWTASQQPAGTLSLAQTRLCCTAKALQSLSTVFLNALFVFKQICLKPFNSLCFPVACFIQSIPHKAAESQ